MLFQLNDRVVLATLLLSWSVLLDFVGSFCPTLPIATTSRTKTVPRSSYLHRSSSYFRLNIGANEDIASEADNDECSLQDDYEQASDCLSMQGYQKADTKSSKPSLLVSEVYIAEVESLKDHFPSHGEPSVAAAAAALEEEEPKKKTTTNGSTTTKNGTKEPHPSGRRPDSSATSHRHFITNDSLFVQDDEIVLVDVRRKPGMASISRGFVAAGPRRSLHFAPGAVRAAICVAGGLCPGLNNVVRELVHTLYYVYDAAAVYGITGGFHGFASKYGDPVLLTNEHVADIHHEGGTILRSSRGGFDVEVILQFLRSYQIDQLYIIGGDGTHRGAYAIHQACLAARMNVAIAGIPKTIDNDIDYIDRSFGFASAVEAAQNGIRSAATEAKCNVPNGIGIIKLMGRSAGFLASFAALGSGDVDLVLVPEVDIVLDGPQGILPFLRRRVQEQHYAVVVVAEGAGEELMGVSDVLDAGGNRARPQIGEFIQKAISQYFDSFGEEATIKYIDPSYMVRSVPANGADSLYCMQLAQNAVHGAMAGLTGFSTGLVNKNPVYLPIPLLVSTSPRSMNPLGTTWERIVAMTGQPNSTVRSSSKQKLSSDDDDQTMTTLASGEDAAFAVEPQEFPSLVEPTVH